MARTPGGVRSLLLILILAAVTPGPVSAGSATAPGGRPDSIAGDLSRSTTLEARLRILDALESRVRRAPDSLAGWIALGRARMANGEMRQARRAFERATTLAPDDTDALLLRAGAERWAWLESLDDEAFHAAESTLRRATELAPARSEPWVELAALALAGGDARAAAGAAVRAQNADGRAAAPVLALACVAYRIGRLRQADSLFAAARERLPAPLAAKFDDLEALGVARADSDATSEAQAFWAALDPDLTTPECEVRLGWLARLAHAMLLFRAGDEVRWDQRTELMVRYGLPAHVVFNRASSELQSFGLHVTPPSTAERVEFGYPYNEQIWSWPALGIQAVIWDRALNGHYVLPAAEASDPDPRVSPDRIAGQPDLVAVAGGRGVYRALPPGLHGRPLGVRIARYPSGDRTRVVAFLRSPGGPADTLRGRWVILDAERRERARDLAPLGVSACDPTEARAVEFAADLPPGDYRAGFAVDDNRGGRGLATVPLHIAPVPAGLAVSDLVLLCGDVASRVADRAVRIEPRDHPLPLHAAIDAYFEISGLASDAGGESRIRLTWRVRRAEEAGRAARPAALEASRDESQTGSLRRQFLHVPAADLPAGSWRLEVVVRDLLSGATAEGTADFVTIAAGDGTSENR